MGVGVAEPVGLGVAVAFGLAVGVGASVGVRFADDVGFAVGLTNIIRIAPSSGTGETMVFFRVASHTPPRSITKRMTTMMVMAAAVFFRSSIAIAYYLKAQNANLKTID